MGYVIKLISRGNGSGCTYSEYWTGKQYVQQGTCYPVCENTICKTVKVFKSKKMAEKSAKNCVEKFLYVEDAVVEEEDLKGNYND